MSDKVSASQPNDRPSRQSILSALRAHRTVLRERFGVGQIALFGSFAHDDLWPIKVVETLVDFERDPTLRSYFGAQSYLERLLGHPVDLVTRRGAPRYRFPEIEGELVHV